MSGHLARLEQAELVERRRPTLDRRRMELHLTPQAESVLRSVRKKRNVWLAERLERLEPRERAAIEAAIGPLARLLEVGE
jgi:DNA-binding MarR family transcriptional regulator